MKRKLLGLFAISLLIAVPLPANASMETCLDNLLQTERFKSYSPFKKAEHRASVEHKGVRYHWIFLSREEGSRQIETVIAENNSGYCHAALFDYGSNYVTKEQYIRTLGKPVVDKFIETAQQ
ncbi:MAG: hypothetical protein HC851_15360 [Acaryochloris sp. RU_4_1]|nr:hypothetical protein [Acaryochloris sp. RU_4_1]NJR57236.1 hypothetical protein [Acaryochloris sp. CRU_2_0]